MCENDSFKYVKSQLNNLVLRPIKSGAAAAALCLKLGRYALIWWRLWPNLSGRIWLGQGMLASLYIGRSREKQNMKSGMKGAH
jgi:hypothetical protein